MSTPVELVDYQHQLGPVLIGRGTTVDIRAIEGLGQVAPRTADVEPPGEDGLWLGPDYYGGRTLRIDAAVKNAGDSGAVLDALALLQDASDTAAVRGQAGTTLALRLKFPGRPTRVVHGRLRKFEPGTETLKHGYVPVDLEFHTADHVYYADESASTSMPLGSLTEGGMTFPLAFPFTIAGDPSAVGRPGYLEVGGNRETWPVMRVSGPCANPTITHVTTGRQLAVQTTLADGEWVEIDTRPGWRSVLRENGGGAPLSPTSRIDQFVLTPGTNEIRWNASDLTLTSTLAVTWWPAYKAL